MNTVEQNELKWPLRMALCGVAFAGSAVYAWSFADLPQREQWLPVAKAIGFAAGVSWILFGLVILLVVRCRPSVMAWADACLITMAAGITMKMVAVAANLISPPGALFHLAVLMAADATMGFVFIRRACRFGMRPLLAGALWVGALNGFFAAIMYGLHAAGWFH